MIPLSLPETFLSLFLRYGVKSVLGPPFGFRFQRAYLVGTALLNLPPYGVRPARLELGGVPTTVLRPTGVPLDGAPDRPVVLYLHGGAFVVGSPVTHLALAGYLARELDAPVHVIDYRLAPEHPYPAGREDALAAYRALLAQGIAPERIVVAGDSAGGVMVADLALDLRAGAGPLPAGLITLSAAFALDEPRPAAPLDTFVSKRWADQAMAAYARPTGDPAHRILGGDLSGLPPFHVQYAQQETFAAENLRFTEELRAAGADPEARVQPGAFHVLALTAGTMKRSRQAVADAAAFARRAVALASARSGRDAA